MHILIAPNAFKNSLDAASVAKAIQKGLQQSKLKCTSGCFPVGDGGDGTASILVKKFKGKMTNVFVHDPLGRKIKSGYGLIDKSKTAVIEMADASGLRLLKPGEYNPMRATSFGTGELIKAALKKGVNKILLCIGGSATIDGAVGILQVLGIRFLDKNKNELLKIPESLVDLEYIDVQQLDKRIFNCQVNILCDVDNVLLGKNGATQIFGPQKGATRDNIKKLEEGLKRLSEVIFEQTGKDISIVKHGGAAGGTAGGLHGILNARLMDGTDYFLELTGFEKALRKADFVVTGEGSIDEQTLHGKAPYGVALRAKKNNIPVIGVAGKIPLALHKKLQKYFDVLLAIGNEPDETKNAMRNTSVNLIRTSYELGNLLALKKIS